MNRTLSLTISFIFWISQLSAQGVSVDFEGLTEVPSEFSAVNTNATSFALTEFEPGDQWLQIFGNGQAYAGWFEYELPDTLDLSTFPYMRLWVHTGQNVTPRFHIYFRDADNKLNDQSYYFVYMDTSRRYDVFADFTKLKNSSAGGQIDLTRITHVGVCWNFSGSLNGTFYIDDLLVGQEAQRQNLTEVQLPIEAGKIPYHFRTITTENYKTEVSMDTTRLGDPEVCIHTASKLKAQGVLFFINDYLNLQQANYIRFKGRAEPATSAFTIVFEDENVRRVEWNNINLNEHESEYVLKLDPLIEGADISQDKIVRLRFWPHRYEADTINFYLTDFQISADAAPQTFNSYQQNFNDSILPYFWLSNDRHELYAQNDSLKIAVNKTDKDHFLNIDFADYYDLSENPYVRFKIRTEGRDLLPPIDKLVLTLRDSSGAYNNYSPEIISYPTAAHETELLYDFTDHWQQSADQSIDPTTVSGLKFEFNRGISWQGTVYIDDFRMGADATPQQIDSYTQQFNNDTLPPYWIGTEAIALTIASQKDTLVMMVNTTSQYDYLPIYFPDNIDISTYPYIAFTVKASEDIPKFAISLANNNKAAVSVIEQAITTTSTDYVLELNDPIFGLDKSAIRRLRLYPNKDAAWSGQIELSDFRIGRAALSDYMCVDKDFNYLKINYLSQEYDNDAPVEGIAGNLAPLSSVGQEGSIISWLSDSPDVMDHDGTVSQPAFIDGDATVKLTATISKGEASKSKTFTCVVEKIPPTDQQQIDLAQTLMPNPLIPIEERDDNIITLAQSIIDQNNDTQTVTVTIAEGDTDQHPQIEENGHIIYDITLSGLITFTLSNASVQATQTITVTVPEKAQTVFNHLKENLPEQLNPQQATDQNVVDMLQYLVADIREDVVVDIAQSHADKHANVNEDGQITYNANAISDTVIFTLVYGFASDTIHIAVNVPKSEGQVISEALMSLPEILEPQEPDHQNIFAMISVLLPQSKPAITAGVQNGQAVDHPAIQENGNIVYGSTLVSDTLVFTLTAGQTSRQTALLVDVPVSLDYQAIYAAIDAIPVSITAIEGIHNNINDLLLLFVNSVSEGISVHISQNGADALSSITEDGLITYQESHTSGDVTFVLQRGQATDTINVLVNVPATTNIERLQGTVNYFYPNPASEFIYFAIDHIDHLSIYNNKGQNVFFAHKPPQKLDISNLSEGIYYLQIRTKGRSYSWQFVKQ